MSNLMRDALSLTSRSSKPIEPVIGFALSHMHMQQ